MGRVCGQGMPGKRQEVRMTTHLRWTNTEMPQLAVQSIRPALSSNKTFVSSSSPRPSPYPSWLFWSSLDDDHLLGSNVCIEGAEAVVSIHECNLRLGIHIPLIYINIARKPSRLEYTKPRHPSR
ncbi:hypothetical protein RRG08_004776 [Elysia crispata]|uniref:Uncharacterized protein n=1 Tax=Elysia crispata TaxID=231223 RepID=A0AAE1AJQ3_9GAST|nr:hypothetical protein RRG08_004776 [Elysia crispata]